MQMAFYFPKTVFLHWKKKKNHYTTNELKYPICYLNLFNISKR